jgi:CDGSH-type Zn-finger protein
MDQQPMTIVFKRRGTIVLEGPVIVLDEDGQVMPQPAGKRPGILKLCGCGRSETKPFCDGSHKKGEEVRSEK